ncbi:MAG: hypothetical protein KatS3mg109_1325 [Pirellulaceae bacterium]|nr:MAG: hypothetical protein KatS3mg109_1325 [Pirellulaceae bacterium]
MHIAAFSLGAKMRCTSRGCKRRAVADDVALCRTHVVRQADRVFSERIRERDRACVRCGSTYRLQCAHIVSRRYSALRWAEDNAVALCQRCHVYFTHRPVEWEAAIGIERAHQLKYRALETVNRVEMALAYLRQHGVGNNGSA